MDATVRKILDKGVAIPAHPLALNSARKLDERRQRRGARPVLHRGRGWRPCGGGAYDVQFEIREPQVGLFEPVLRLAAEEMNRAGRPLVRVAGVCGKTPQAVKEPHACDGTRVSRRVAQCLEARCAEASEDQLIAHCREVSSVIPIVGFYLQPAVGGGRVLPYSASGGDLQKSKTSPRSKDGSPFNRYQTLDVVRAVMEAGRDDIALYTGNDDNIVMDLITPYRLNGKERRIVGGLLGHWSVWAKKAVELLETCHRACGHIRCSRPDSFKHRGD